jgi:hypothetical protein
MIDGAYEFVCGFTHHFLGAKSNSMYIGIDTE